MATVSECVFTITTETGNEHTVKLKAGMLHAGMDDEEDGPDFDPEDTIIEWEVYLDRQWKGKLQGTMVEVVSGMYGYVLDKLQQPQRYLQAKAEMRLDDEEEPSTPTVESLFV